MEKPIPLIDHQKIISEYQLMTAWTISIADCDHLATEFSEFNVTDYCLANLWFKGYLTRFLACEVDQAPTLIYKNRYLLPLLFRYSEDTKKMFTEMYRWQALFLLLEWYLKYEPKKVILAWDETGTKKVIDTAFLVFRLSEICDGAAYSLSRCNSLTDFIDWNNEHHLIDTQHENFRGFDPDDAKDLAELEVILAISKLRYLTLDPLHES